MGETTPFAPQMVWIDPYGNVMICYGLIVGNLYERSLGEVLRDYAITQSLLLGVLAEEGSIGSYRLAVAEGLQPEETFTDECDLCGQTRSFLGKMWPGTLGFDECYPEKQ